LGNDPYQSSTFRIQKNRLYRYDLLWRENDYFNPALTIANGEHFMNTSRRMQDHSLTLLPQSPLKVFLGYTRNSQTGPALSTIQLFDSRGDEFPLFENIRRLQDEIRIGAELQAFGIRLSFLRGWEHFRDDTTDQLNQFAPGNNPNDRTTLSNFNRSQPNHGSSGNWRVHLMSERSKLYSVAGRFTYSGGRRDFIFDEGLLGTDRVGTARTLQTQITGNARRPVLATNLTLNVFLSPKLTVTNHTAYNDTRIDGDALYRQVNNTSLASDSIYFQFLGIRTISNTTDATYRINNWASFFGGYQFSTRHVRSVEQQTFFNTPDRLAVEQDNTLNSGLFGVRFRPLKPLAIRLDAEVGRTDHPFYPIGEKNYHALSGSLQYKLKSLTIGASTRTNYNTNSVSLSSHSSRSRTYSADVSWALREWVSLDAGYNKLHLDTASGIAYFANGDLTGGSSIYISNIHAANLGVRFAVLRRADVYLGYSRTQDTGDGRDLRHPPAFSTPDQLTFYLAQTFPLTYESPIARLSVRVTNKLRWNGGYQFYHYREDLSDQRNYRAHTGYTSLTWSF